MQENGDVEATNRVISNYERFVCFTMNKYYIENKSECYETVVERILRSIFKFPI